MLLGVFLHAAKVYSVDGTWLLTDPQGNQAFNVLSDLIHVFRMPAFFWISGYFCASTFDRRGADALLLKRLPRILIPLFATLFTLNIAQKMLLASFNGKDMMETLLNGIPLYHLWFLIDLTIFTGIAAVVLPAMAAFKSIGTSLAKLPLTLMFLSLGLFSLIISLGARSTGVAYGSIYSLTSIFRLAEYGPFFAVGILMFQYPTARSTFMRISPMLIWVTLPLGLFLNKYLHDSNFVISELALFIKGIIVWLSVASVLGFFYSFIKKDNRLIHFLSEASFSVYLFHHILVIIAGVALFNYDINVWIKYLIVCTVSLTGSILIHITLIRRNRIARLLFNGIFTFGQDKKVAPGTNLN